MNVAFLPCGELDKLLMHTSFVHSHNCLPCAIDHDPSKTLAPSPCTPPLLAILLFCLTSSLCKRALLPRNLQCVLSAHFLNALVLARLPSLHVQVLVSPVWAMRPPSLCLSCVGPCVHQKISPSVRGGIECFRFSCRCPPLPSQTTRGWCFSGDPSFNVFPAHLQ